MIRQMKSLSDKRKSYNYFSVWLHRTSYHVWLQRMGLLEIAGIYSISHKVMYHEEQHTDC